MNLLTTYKTANRPIIALCFLGTLLVFFYLFFILPHSGLDFADSGFALYSGLFLVNHSIAFDWIALPRPSFLTAFFMLLGIKNVFFMQFAFTITLILSTALTLVSIEKKLWIIIPSVCALGLYNEPLTIGSYENTPTIFLMLSIAFFFFSQNQQNILRCFLITCSAFFLSISVTTNVSVLPAGFFAAIFLWVLYKTKFELLLFSEFILFVSLIAYIYISFIGINAISQLFTPEHSSMLLEDFVIRSLSIGYLLLKITLLAIIMVKIPKFLYWKKTKIFPSPLWNSITSMILIMCLTPFLRYLFPLPFFSGNTQWLFILALLILILATGGIINFTNSKNKPYIKLLSVFIIGIVYYSCQAIVTDNPILIPLNYYSCLFATIFLSLFYLQFSENKDTVDKKICSIFCIPVIFLLTLGIHTRLNFSYGNGKTTNNTVELQRPLLKHIYVTPEKKQLIDTLSQTYINYNCNKKPFIAFYDLPIFYYLFQRSAPLHESWIESWPNNSGFPHAVATDENIMQWLKQRQKWCVFYSPGFANKTPDKNIEKFLQKNSIRIVKINYTGTRNNIWLESAPTVYNIFIK